MSEVISLSWRPWQSPPSQQFFLLNISPICCKYLTDIIIQILSILTMDHWCSIINRQALMMRFPGLLRNKYLDISPLWLSYLQGNQLSDLSAYCVNHKLLAAVAIKQWIKDQQKAAKQFRNILQTQLAKSLQKNASGDIEKDYSLEKAALIYKMHDSININIRKHSQQQFIQAIASLTLKDHPQKQQWSNFIQHYIKESQDKDKGIDQLDLLLLEVLLPQDIQILVAITEANFNWQDPKFATIPNYIWQYLSQVRPTNMNANSRWEDVRLLKRMSYNLQHYSPQWQALHSILSLTSLTLKAPLSKYALANPEVIADYYLIYLNWLAVRLLYRPTWGSFLSNMNTLTSDVNYVLKNKLAIKNKNDIRDYFCCLQIINWTYDQLLISPNIVKMITLLPSGIEYFQNFRKCKINLQRKIYRMMEQPHKDLDCQAILQSLCYAIRVTNTLNHPALVKIGIKSVVQIIQGTPVFALEPDIVNSLHFIAETIAKGGSLKNESIGSKQSQAFFKSYKKLKSPQQPTIPICNKSANNYKQIWNQLTTSKTISEDISATSYIFRMAKNPTNQFEADPNTGKMPQTQQNQAGLASQINAFFTVSRS